MTTVIDALVTQITNKYGDSGGGGAAPTNIKNLNEIGNTPPYPASNEYVVVYRTRPARRVPFNENYVDLTHELYVIVSTPTSDDRLKEIVDEVRLVINNYAITGVHVQYVSDEREISNRRDPVFAMEIVVTMIENMVASATSYGSAAAAPHLHDTDILEHDGVDSDGGAFPFTTTGKVTFNQEVQVNKLTLEDGGTFDVFRDEDNMVSDDADAVASQQSIKKYVDDEVGGAGGDAFKTITGITDDVVADAAADTLTLASTDAKLTIVGTPATDTVTFTVVEGQIDHDALTNFVAAEHKLEADIDHDALTNFVAAEHKLEADINHDALTNFAAGEHFTMLDEDNMISDDATKAATQQSIKKYVDDNAGGADTVARALGMYGSANKAWVPLALEAHKACTSTNNALNPPGSPDSNGYGGMLDWQSNQAEWALWVLTLPTVKNGLELHYDDIRVGLAIADANSYIDKVWVSGTSGGWGSTVIDSDPNNLDSAAMHTIATADRNCGSHQSIKITLKCINTAGDLWITGVFLQCYYADTA